MKCKYTLDEIIKMTKEDKNFGSFKIMFLSKNKYHKRSIFQARKRLMTYLRGSELDLKEQIDFFMELINQVNIRIEKNNRYCIHDFKKSLDHTGTKSILTFRLNNKEKVKKCIEIIDSCIMLNKIKYT